MAIDEACHDGGSIPRSNRGAQRRGEGEATAAWRRQRRAPSSRSRNGTGSGCEDEDEGRRGGSGVGGWRRVGAIPIQIVGVKGASGGEGRDR